MSVRGAPLIGATAAFGMALAARSDARDAALDEAAARLIAARPTADNTGGHLMQRGLVDMVITGTDRVTDGKGDCPNDDEAGPRGVLSTLLGLAAAGKFDATAIPG